MGEGIQRRDFLKVVGAGGVGAGMFGCSTEEVEKLLPYVVPPEDITPGVATWYATTCGECAAGCGAWARTREGRVVKLEGNPHHPVSRGGLCSRGHSSLQGLYNPDRFSGPLAREEGELRAIAWDEAEALLAARMDAGGGRSLLLTGRLGPSMEDLVERFASATGGRRVEYEALSEAPLREAARIVFGEAVVPTYRVEEARFLLSFGADFLESWLSPVRYAKEFARMSATDSHGSKGRFVFLGPRLSLTGQNADEWVPLKPGSEASVALAMAHVIVERRGGGEPYIDLLGAYTPGRAAEDSGIAAADIQRLAERFLSEGPGLALGPGVAGHHRNATAANVAVLVLNAVAGNVGRTLFLRPSELGASARPYGEMASAIREMDGGEVDVVLVHGSNPAYSLPAAAAFRDAFGKVPFKVSLASHPDETSAQADLILPDRHFLEAWGDSNPRPGIHALRQPVMRPLPHFDSKQTGDVLLSLAARLGHPLGEETFKECIQTRWREIHRGMGDGADFEAFWRETLRRGVVGMEEEAAGSPPELRAPEAGLNFDAPAFDGDGDFVLLVHPSPRFGDGAQANRPWLQELPDPVSKIAWHAWVEMNPVSAERLDLRKGDIVTVRSPHGEVEVPVWTYPGIREDVVALAMGGGHEDYGRFADGVGVNAMSLLPAEMEEPSGALVHVATRVSLDATGRRRRLATIEGSSDQDHRPITPAVALADLSSGGHGEGAEPTGEEEGEEAGGHGAAGHQELQAVGGFGPVPSEGKPEEFPLEGARHGEYDPEKQPRWAMAIDLDKCTGCSACVTACQAENNVPWVGEELVLQGRDMHWIRLERYYEEVDATQAAPVDIRHLPMLCQHCGNAPCEPVCPVFAAYHTPDGLNGQVYNRCVGTRYCANNCPYKVRVFNWFTYTDVPEPMNWQYNPDVTVREGGVMEKCSFCVQRIRDAQNRAALEERDVVDGEVVPACEQSCPADAIVFGNIRDPHSKVAQVSANERSYRVLDAVVNTQPAVTYLKKVTFHPVEPGGHG